MKMLLFILIFNTSISLCLDKPHSFDNSNYLDTKDNVDLLITEIPDIESLLKYSDSLDIEGVVHPEFYGYEYKFDDLNINSVGTWEELPNGDRLWRYHIICPSAFTVNFVLSNVNIADNSTLFFYNEINESVIGPFDKRINRKHKLFSSHTIEGESVFIELYEPRSDLNKNNFNVNKVIYGYKEINTQNTISSKYSSVQSSHSCNLDVNCSEGDEFCREKYSVAVVVSPSQQELLGLYAHPLWHHCSGALVNNTALDYKPYFLTALHCIIDYVPPNTSYSQIVDQWSFKFGYITEDCNSGTYRQTKVYSGADIISYAAFTDFLLVELQDDPKSGDKNGFNDVYFSGWDVTNNTPTSTKSLHHPKGDYMNIAVDDDSPFIQGYTAGSCNDSVSTSTTHYFRTSLDKGTMESGSSGSPLYNQDRRIVAQTRRGCGCNIPDSRYPGQTFSWFQYGRLYHSWDDFATSINHLKTWLDPIGSGVTTLDGMKMPNLQFGWIFPTTSVTHYAAYTDMQIGSNSTSSYKVESGAELSLKAGREIKISPCTQIKAGSEFRAYIEEPDCDDIVPLSDKLTDHDPNYCSSYPKLAPPRRSTENYFELNEPILKVAPNPITSVSDIKLTIADVGNISLTLYDNLGNKRYTYIDGASMNRGTYNYTIDGNKMNSGMYVLVLKVDDQIITKKVMNIK